MSQADTPTIEPMDVSIAHRDAGEFNSAAIVAIAFVVSLLLCKGQIADTWTTGNFYDSDDAMRITQLRDFVAGQAWYDLNAHRLDPPLGMVTHWSRAIDAPLAGLLRIISPFTDSVTAERIARIVWPLFLQGALLSAMAWLARLLLGARGVVFALALTVLSGFMFGQFTPGRVDHEGAQIVLMLLMLGAYIAALDPARAWMAAASAAIASLSLAISLENLPFVIALLAAAPLTWVVMGPVARSSLLWFAGGVVASAAPMLALFRPPAEWFMPACDAVSRVHVVIMLADAGVCLILAAAQPLQSTLARRASAAAILALLFGAPLSLAYAACLIDPFIDLDPVVRAIWLVNVTEAQPGLRYFAQNAGALRTLAIPAMIGVLGLAIAALRERSLLRVRFVVVLAFALMGCIATSFMIRAATALAPIAVLGAAWLATRLYDAMSRTELRRPLRLAVTLCALLPMSSFGWALAPLPRATETPETAESANTDSCLAAHSYEPLAALPAGLALAPIEYGAHLLAHTPHSVITAPFHRANHGNRLAINIFSAALPDARAMAKVNGVDYVVTCPDAKELRYIARRAPDGLAAIILKDVAVDWLQPVALKDTPLRAWRVR